MRGHRALAVAAVTTMAFAATPAHAVTDATFRGTAYISCFGCGTSQGTADFTVSGIFDNRVLLNAPATATFANETPSGAMCLATGTAQGSASITGAGTYGFTWVRIGAHAVVNVPSARATGTATFVVTSPVGNPCGGPVTATFSGHLEGI